MDDSKWDRDAVFSEGYRAGRRDLLKNVRRQVKEFKSQKAVWTNILGDAGKLASLVEHNPEFKDVILTTAIALILKDDSVEKEWDNLSKDDD